jgi:hypothetical protein
LGKGPQVVSGGAMSSFADDAGEHLFYVGADNHVHQLYFGSSWTDQDLTAYSNGPQAMSGSAMSSFPDDAGEHVFYTGEDQHVHQLYYSAEWTDQDLTASGKGPQAMSSQMPQFRLRR